MRIFDTQQQVLYKVLSKAFPDNFYLKLAANVVPPLLDRKAKQTSGVTTEEFKVLGNDIKFTFGGATPSLSVNGQSIPAEGRGADWFKNVVLALFKAEAEGLSIKRPDNRTRKQDRLEFKDAQGTMFPALIDQVAFASGKQDLGAKGNAVAKRWLSEADFSRVPESRRNDFEERSNSKATYYIKKGTQCLDVTDSGIPLSRVVFAVENPGQPRSTEMLARTIPEVGDMVADPNPQDPFYVLVSGAEAVLVEVTRNNLKVTNLSMKKPEVKSTKKYTEEDLHDPDYEAFLDWCSANGVKPSENAYNKYKKSSRATDSADTWKGRKVVHYDADLGKKSVETILYLKGKGVSTNKNFFSLRGNDTDIEDFKQGKKVTLNGGWIQLK